MNCTANRAAVGMVFGLACRTSAPTPLTNTIRVAANAISGSSADTPCVFVSPHLDDAVFSCGGLILKLRSIGRAVRVVTVFNASPDMSGLPKPLKKYAHYDRRMQEDSDALRSIGVEYSYLNLVERAFVKPHISNPPDVFKSPRGGVADYLYTRTTQDALRKLMNESPGCKIFVPLGIGNHVDHVQLFIAAMGLMRDLRCYDRIYFYEDAYAWYGNRVRIKHPIAAQFQYQNELAPERASLKAFFTSLVFSFAINTDTIRPYLNDHKSKFTWNIHLEDIDPVVEAKYAVMSKYASQVADFGGMDFIRKGSNKYYALWHGCEPYWFVADARSPF